MDLDSHPDLFEFKFFFNDILYNNNSILIEYMESFSLLNSVQFRQFYIYSMKKPTID